MWIGLLAGLALLALLLGVWLLARGRRDHAASGLPTGKVVYTDTATWEAVPAPLISRRYGLVGKPDYLVRTRIGTETQLIPVEVKSRAQPARPLDSHVLQLATYCLLVEDVYKVRPPHGLLHYRDATLEIAYTDELRAAVLAAADAIRRARHASDQPRTHDDPARCRGCGYAHACGEVVPPRR
jgi:CRISPR-associated exonuclease Cas4